MHFLSSGFILLFSISIHAQELSILDKNVSVTIADGYGWSPKATAPNNWMSIKDNGYKLLLIAIDQKIAEPENACKAALQGLAAKKPELKRGEYEKVDFLKRKSTSVFYEIPQGDDSTRGRIYSFAHGTFCMVVMVQSMITDPDEDEEIQTIIKTIQVK